MLKTCKQISVLFLLCFNLSVAAQKNYHIYIKPVDKDSIFIANVLGLQTDFSDRLACIAYVNKLPGTLQSKGFVTASMDSLSFDSAFAKMQLYIGAQYIWGKIEVQQKDLSLLDAVGWNYHLLSGKPMDYEAIDDWKNKLLDYLENHGHPFAKISLDSLQFDNEKVFAQLKVEKGILYKIDSIRIIGSTKLSNEFLQRYLDIRNGSTYSKQKLRQITKKISDLAFVESERQSDLTILGTGAVLNLYLKPKKSSQANVLIGFLPNSNSQAAKKTLVTGEANISLKNQFGSGEIIGLNWQQLQVKSPRLNVAFQYPYVFHSPVGIDFSLDMFAKDSTFLNLNLQLGVQYLLGLNQTGKIFLQKFQTILNGINTASIIQTKHLPDVMDISATSVGIDYEFNNSNNRLNPRRGNELRIVTTVGTKKLKKNNQILELKDPNNPSFNFESLYDTIKMKTYQARFRVSAAKYFPVGKQSTVKTALQGGFFQSGSTFRNELFQIGGFKLLRGFDEESQYLSQFAIGTVEYRLLAGQANSYFYVFSDAGWGKNNSQGVNLNYTYISTGLGISFENKIGLFNLAWAVGKRNDGNFNLRQSKVHFGFINYF